MQFKPVLFMINYVRKKGFQRNDKFPTGNKMRLNSHPMMNNECQKKMEQTKFRGKIPCNSEF